MQSLAVSDNGRFLVKENGEPFFWLGDTAWQLLHCLSYEQAQDYMRCRAEMGFNVIQTVILAEAKGLTRPNAYGQYPLKKNIEGVYDPLHPDLDGDYSYWDHVDRILDLAEQLNLYVALLPTWGDKFNLKHGTGPVIFNPQNAFGYGQWLAQRYGNRTNVIWVLGGDRPLVTDEHKAIIRQMALGLQEGAQLKQLMTFHPPGEKSSSQYVQDEEWLSFHMVQSGHGRRLIANYAFISEDYSKQPIKPVLDAEPCYEDIPIGFDPAGGYFDAADVRCAAYYAVFAGAFGHTYGQHSIWSMTTSTNANFIMTWQQALHRPGAAQMKHLRTLMEGRNMMSQVPDQSLIHHNYEGANYAVATRGERYAMIYIPCGLAAQIDVGRLEYSEIRIAWYSPRDGSWLEAGRTTNQGIQTFSPPTAGRGEDWVLVLDAQ